MDKPENSRKPTGEQGVSPKDASQPLEPVSLLRRDANGTRPARIIWLDDDESIAETFSIVFGLFLKDYIVVHCVNGDEALREIDRHPPDLLLTDYLHFGASFEVMLLHLSEKPARFPILLVSGCEDQEGLKRKFSTFTFTIELISKPCDSRDLITAVLKHLKSSNPLPPPLPGLALDASSLRGSNSGRI